MTDSVPHGGGRILGPGVSNVLIGGLPAAVSGSRAQCAGATSSITSGLSTVLIGGLPAARRGDRTAHGGVIVTGLGTVLIGG